MCLDSPLMLTIRTSEATNTHPLAVGNVPRTLTIRTSEATNTHPLAAGNVLLWPQI